MGLVLILCWCSAVVGRWGGPNIIPGSARLFPGSADASSRFTPLREFPCTGLICLTVFTTRGRVFRKNRQNSPVRREKPGIFVGLSERAVVQPPDSECRPALLRADRIKPNPLIGLA